MSESRIEKYMFVDFENLPNFKINSKFNTNSRIYLFVNSSQLKIPIEVAIESQRMGDRLEWVMVNGTGKNNLDFHMCFFMGIQHRDAPLDVEFELYSKDLAFDHLIEYLNQTGRRAKRLTFDSTPSTRRPIQRRDDDPQF